MKKNYLKKSLSLIMTVVMLMTCWVFVAPTEAEAVSGTVYGVPAINGSHYNAGTTNAYGTPVFDGNTDRWFLWQNGDDWTKIYYPSQIYLDKSESLQAAGYYFNIQWHFGDGAKYRTFLGANIWGDHSQWSGYPERYYTMNNIFSNYAVDASLPDGYNGDGGLYGKNTGSSSNYDLRIVGYNHAGQGTDQFSYNDTTHTKYVSLRSRQTTNNATLYLMGNPNSSYVGKTSEYNTSGNSFGGYGYAQKDGSTHKNGSNVYAGKGDDSSYREGEWIEMQWFVTVYDKSALNDLINSATTKANDAANYDRASRQSLASAIATAKVVLTKRATNQTEIDNAKSTLQTAVNNLVTRKYDVTYENIFSISDWKNSDSCSTGGSSGSVNVENDKAVKLYKSGAGSEVYTGSSYSGNHRDSMYAMSVVPGEKYTVSFNLTSTGSGSITPQIFLFWYDSSNTPVYNVEGNNTFNNATFSGNGKHSATFTVPSGATKAEIRFDNDSPSSETTLTFNDISVCLTKRYDANEIGSWTSRPVTKAYTKSSVLGTTLDVPVRKGYDFNGWYLDSNANNQKDSGEEVTDATGTVLSNRQSFAVETHYNLYADWTPKAKDVGYDNIFSLADWALTSSNSVNANATDLQVDVEAGTIAVTGMSDAFTIYGGGSDQYHMPVTAGKEYIFDYDVTSTNGTYQAFVFFYDASGNGVTGALLNGVAQSNAHIGFYNGQPITFTVPSGCTQIGIRIGICGTESGTATYSNIGVYEKAAYDAYAKDYIKVREPFKYGDTTILMEPTRENYAFDGWFTADGRKLTSVSGLAASETVYAQWTREWTVTYVDNDGNVIVTKKVKNGENVADEPSVKPTKDPDANYSYTFAGWDNDGKNVTSDITIKPVFTGISHSNFTFKRSGDGATCDRNAYTIKICGECGYEFEKAVYNPAEDPDAASHTAWLAKGHKYNENDILEGSSSGNSFDDTHKIKCERYATCGSTQDVKHNFSETDTVGADCVTAGTTHWGCPCGAATTTTGDTDSSKHSSTKLVNYVAPTCTTPGKDYDTVCDNCGEVIVEGATIKALEHSFTNYVSNNDATCTEDGTKTAICDRADCDATKTIPDEGSAKDHSFTKYVSDGNATCTKDGTKTATCDRADCDATKTIPDEGSATGHDYAVSANIKNNDNGTHSYLCANGCGTYGYEVTENASTTCVYGEWDTTAEATHSKTCDDCGYVYTENHKWTAWTPVDITAETESKMTRECEICGKEVESDCSYTIIADKAATCTTQAFRTYKCNDCGHSFTVLGEAAKGHNFTGEYKYNSTNDAHQQLCANGCGNYGYGIGDTAVVGGMTPCTWTYENKASGTHTASCVCGNSQDEACSGGTATCTAPANCAFCGKAYGTTSDHSFKGDAVKLDGDFHAYLCEYCGTTNGIGKVEGDKEACSGGTATCSALAVCEICEDTYGELNAANHKWGNWINLNGKEIHKRVCEYNNTHEEEGVCASSNPVVIAPDCEAQGYTLNTCDLCAHEWNTDYTTPAGHEWGAWVMGENLTHTRTCTVATCTYGVDGAAKTETASCTKENATSEVTAPTCTEEGYTTYTCKDCGNVWVDDTVAANGHNFTAPSTKTDYKRSDKNCTTALTYWFKCVDCDVSAETAKNGEVDEATLYWVKETATGHNFTAKRNTTEYLKSKATCTERAVYYYSCANADCTEKGTETFDFGSALGHDWKNEGTDLYKAADCVNDAVYYQTCATCTISAKDDTTNTGSTWTDIGSADGHDFDHENGYTEYKAAECNVEGNYAYYTCNTCKKNFADNEGKEEMGNVVIPALSHKWIYHDYKAPTCEEDGHSAHRVCDLCGVKGEEYELKEKTGHKFTGEVVFDSIYNHHAYKCKNANCTEHGIGTGADAVKYSVEYDGIDYVVVGGIPCTFGAYTTSTDENGIHSHISECECGNKSVKAIDNVTTQVIDPTCEEDGYTLNTCNEAGCTDTWKTAVVAALTHDLGDAISNGDDTHYKECGRENCDYVTPDEACYTATPVTECGALNTCDACGAKFGSEVAHVFTDYKYNNDAKCEIDGTETAECDNCDTGATDTRTAVGSATGHNMSAFGYVIPEGWDAPEFDESSIREPNCKTEGLMISYCTNDDCTEFKTQVVATNSEHEWGEWTPIGGNCSTGVVVARVCGVCNKKETDTKPAAHSWKVIVVQEATCAENGYIDFMCSDCRFTCTLKGADASAYILDGTNYADIYNVISLGNHTWQTTAPATGNYEVIDGYIVFIDKYPSYNADGRGYHKCTVCPATESVAIPAYGNAPEDHKHPELGINDNSTLKYVAEVKASCTSNGHAAYYECTRCSYSEYMINHDAMYYPATGHVDADRNGKCDTCNAEVDADSPSFNCGCLCHSKGFMGFIYKIVKFFWKLFGMNKECSCGITHY